MMNEPNPKQEELSVTFIPQLFLQRRLWILNILRRENILDLLDIGCGEGSLLSTLCQSAPWLPTENLIPECGPNNNFKYLYPSRVRGLDINEQDLNFAIDSTKPRSYEDQSQYSYAMPRWQSLSTQIWKGSLQVINEQFINTECIVSSEVIEHLTPDVLPAFGPMLLGVYHPKFLLITTPSYTFNARFTSPDAPPSARTGYPDPTGRTDRIFRHDDHKFEWTEEEFSEWCHEQAELWGYEIKLDSVGCPKESDPFGRSFNGASQVAAFTRPDRDVKWREEKGRKVIAELALAAPDHEVLSDETHQPHPISDKPSALSCISEAVVEMMESISTTIVRFEDLWFQRDEIPLLCGGRIDVLADAIGSSPEILHFQKDLTCEMESDRSEWNVRLVQGLTSKPLPVGETSLDQILDIGWMPSEASDDEDYNPAVPPSEWSGVDGDISRDGSDTDEPSDLDTPSSGWGYLGPGFPNIHGNPEDKNLDDSGSQKKKPVIHGWGYEDSSDSANGWESAAAGGWEADQSQNDVASA